MPSRWHLHALEALTDLVCLKDPRANPHDACSHLKTHMLKCPRTLSVPPQFSSDLFGPEVLDQKLPGNIRLARGAKTGVAVSTGPEGLVMA